MEAKKGFPKWFMPVVLGFVVIIGITTTVQYSKIFDKNNKEKQSSRLRTAAFYSKDLIEEDPHFAEFIDWVLHHQNDLLIPVDYKNDLIASETAFNEYMNKHHDEMYRADFEKGFISIDDLDIEGQKLYAKYRMEYWHDCFSGIKENYNLSELSFLYPIPNKEYTAIVMIDPGNVNIGNAFLNINQEKYFDPKDNIHLWQTWEEELTMEDCDETPNLAFTNIVISDSDKIGLIHAVA